MSVIFLIGFMGAGKTTVARALCGRNGSALIEMDEQIEAQEGQKISDIFAEHGEEYFRGLETAFLESLQPGQNAVVSCGGGVPMRECNRQIMRSRGTVVYLSARPETIYERVRDAHTRPVLEGNMNTAYIRKLLEARLPAYRAAADLTVETDGRTAEEIAAEIDARQP